MAATPWKRAARLFDELVALEPADRDERLAALRDEDADLASQVAALLAVDGAPGGLLDRGLSGVLPGTGEGRETEAAVTGRIAGPYRLLRSIGRGGMGAVYEAERADGLYQQRVAIKVLASPGSPELVGRFQRERAILATLEHPHIARLLDAGSLGDRPYLVMELVDGDDIATHCDRTRADIATRLRLFLDVCDAVAYAHRHLIVHRDLKPSNVLVNERGEVKLLDFGIAALFDPEGPAETSTTFARRAFTPAYAAPEQVLGEPVSTATDVYALGALLHELLVGRPPKPALVAPPGTSTNPLTTTLAELSPDEAAETAARRALAGPRQLARMLRGDLAVIAAVALRPQPGDRYGSVQELADDIERHLGGRPVRVRRDDRAYRVRSFVRRNRVAIAASTVAIAGLVAGLLIALAQAREARAETLRASALRQFVTYELKRRIQDRLLEPGGPRLGSMFERGLADVDREFAGQPEVAAEIFSIAGETFFMMKDSRRAIVAFRGALQRSRALYGDGDSRVASARGNLAHALLEHGDLAEAQPLLESLTRPDSPLPGDERYYMLSYLGRLYVLRGNLAAAERARRQALAVIIGLHERNPDNRGRALERLAAVLYLEGRLRETEKLLSESLAVQPLWPTLPEMLWLRRAYAAHRMGELAAASRAYAQAEAANASRANVWTAGRIACGRALARVEEGDPAAARALLVGGNLAIADRAEEGSLEHRESGIPCGSLLAWLGADLPALKRSLSPPAEPSPISDLDRAERDLLLADLLLSHGRAAEALPLCVAVVRVRDANPDLLPWRRAEAHLLHGLVLTRLGRDAEGGPEIARNAPVLAAALPHHRFLRLAAATTGNG
ncbi:MAG TPA: serine/threonine-protein kinase [Thermoanaerobaculia bacterium]|nr:serine/threonine-protein kinase [Thermoanaerobaculia bacterium]